MKSYTITWKALPGDPPFPDKPRKNTKFDVSHGAKNTCEFPLPAPDSYGIMQVFCKKCRHLNNIVMTGRSGDYTVYKVDCGKVRTVKSNENKQLELMI